MNVTEFIEFHYLTTIKQSDVLNYLGIPVILPDYKLDMQRFKQERKFAEFLKREFKPEMILWFEGTSKIEESPKYLIEYEIGDYVIQFWDGNKYMRHYKYAYNINIHGYNKANHISHYPSTLADFMSDCRRAGIKLKFKKGCANV